MSFALPGVLFGLLLLPLLWWLHRRLRKPPDIVLPSLMFLQDEEDVRALPRGRVLDAELLLAASGFVLLLFSAAGPEIVLQRSHREVQVVVSGGTAAGMRGYAQRTEAVLADLRAGLRDEDVLHLRTEPGPAEDDVFTPRPDADALLAAARVGTRSLRVVISDQAPPPDVGDVHWVSIGEPGVFNAGIVAVSVREEAGQMMVFFTVSAHTEETRELGVTGEATAAGGGAPTRRSLTWSVPRHGLVSGSLGFPPDSRRIVLRVGDAFGLDLDDALAADDVVVLERRPLRVYLHPDLPRLHEPIRRALEAVRGAGGFTELEQDAVGDADLAFAPVWAPLPGSPWILTLQPVAPGEAVRRAPPGANPRGRDPLVKDLSGAGQSWVYASGAEEPAPDARVLLARLAAKPWPLVTRTGRRVHLVPDPLRGEPPVVETPFWPLLLANLVEVVSGGAEVGAGFRAHGVLDAATSTPGRVQGAFEPRRIGDAAPSVEARTRPLRGLGILGALSCLLLLWGAPRIRRRLTRLRPRPA